MFFCFKQKTAYEMRISDWSSDVCSSDLPIRLPQQPSAERPKHSHQKSQRLFALFVPDLRLRLPEPDQPEWPPPLVRRPFPPGETPLAAWQARDSRRRPRRHIRQEAKSASGYKLGLSLLPFMRHRSEEHTSELQSLMRIS